MTDVREKERLYPDRRVKLIFLNVQNWIELENLSWDYKI